jgi:hypothetical protein
VKTNGLYRKKQYEVMAVSTEKAEKGKPKDFKNKDPEPTKPTSKKRMPAATELDIENALRASGGFISRAARRLGKDHSSISQRIKKSPRLQEVLNEILESQLDIAEDQLMKLMAEGSLGAICFYLKCKGKHRGYVEKQEINFTGFQICVTGQGEPDRTKVIHDLSRKDYSSIEEEPVQIAD